MMKVLIADDHALLRDGLKPFVSRVGEDVSILESCDYPSTHEVMAAQRPDLVLLDLKMPGMDGTDGVLRLRRAFPDVRIVIVTGWVTRSDVLEAMRLGVSGYLPKSLNGTAMMHALRLILCGVPYYPPEVLTAADAAPTAAGESADTPRERSPLSALTRREYEILTQLVGAPRTRKSPRFWGSPRSPSSPTCATSSARSARATAPRRWPWPCAKGSRRRSIRRPPATAAAIRR